jgi:thiol-disulfide isomerase/thioredoxin
MIWRKNSQIFLLLGGVAFGLIIGLAVFVLQKNGKVNIPQNPTVEQNGIPTVGLAMPNFEISLLGGEKVELKNYVGRSVVVNFWGTWCPPCRAEMPMLEQAAIQYKPQLVLIGINEEDTLSNVKDFIRLFNLTFLIGMDDGKKIANHFNVQGYPTTYFIGDDGILRMIQVGQMSVQQFQINLSKIGINP